MLYFKLTDWRRVSAAHNQRDESPGGGGLDSLVALLVSATVSVCACEGICGDLKEWGFRSTNRWSALVRSDDRVIEPPV